MSLLSTIIQEPAWKPHRFFIYGPPGVGKTSLACSAPKPILLRVGQEDFPATISCPSWPDSADSFQTVIDRMTALYLENHDFETFILDSITGLASFIYGETCKERKKDHIEDWTFSKGYDFAMPYWTRIKNGLDKLREKGMTVILISHEKIKHFDSPEGDGYDRYMPLLDIRSSPMFVQWADNVLHLTYQIHTSKTGKGLNERTKAKGGERRVIRTQERGFHVGKNRLIGETPYEIPLEKEKGWDEIAKYIPKPKPKDVKVENEPKKEGE